MNTWGRRQCCRHYIILCGQRYSRTRTPALRACSTTGAKRSSDSAIEQLMLRCEKDSLAEPNTATYDAEGNNLRSEDPDVRCKTHYDMALTFRLRLETPESLDEPDEEKCDFMVHNFPIETGDQKVALADSFLQLAEDPMDAKGYGELFYQFFEPGVIRRATLWRYNGPIETGLTAVPAVQFYAVLQKEDIHNKKLWYDNKDPATEDDAVSIGVTFPMETRADKLKFVRALGQSKLHDYMRGGARVPIYFVFPFYLEY